MITNKGITQTSIYNNNQKHDINKIEWDASYDGKIANINVDLDENGNKKHVNMSLNNEDLAELLNIPSVNEDLHKRIKNDFKNISLKSYKNYNSYSHSPLKKNKSQKIIKPLFIELEKNNFPGKNNIDDITVFDKDIIMNDDNYDYISKSIGKNRLNNYSRKYKRKHNKKNRTPKTLRLKFNKKSDMYIL